MSYVRIWLHCVWGTKNRIPFLNNSNKQKILNHIKENAIHKNIYIDFINGHREHVHCSISLNADQTLSKVMQLIKGESSFWINKNQLPKVNLNGQMNILRFLLVSHKLIMCGNTLKIRKSIIKRKVGRMNTMNLSKSMVLKRLMAKARLISYHIFPIINDGVSQSGR